MALTTDARSRTSQGARNESSGRGVCCVAWYCRARSHLGQPESVARAPCPQRRPSEHGRSRNRAHASCPRALCSDPAGQLGHCAVTLEAPPRPDHATQNRARALSGFMSRVALTDLLVITWAVLGAQLLRFGPQPVEDLVSHGLTSSVAFRYSSFSSVLVAAWLLMLRIHGAYDHRLLPACQGELRPAVHSKPVPRRARFGLIPDEFFNAYPRTPRWSDGSFTATLWWQPVQVHLSQHDLFLNNGSLL